jgi:hypothetical protein
MKITTSQLYLVTMMRIKHIARQIILDNTEINAKAKLAKIARNQETKDDKSTKKTRSLLRDTRRKSRRFKQKSN